MISSPLEFRVEITLRKPAMSMSSWKQRSCTLLAMALRSSTTGQGTAMRDLPYSPRFVQSPVYVRRHLAAARCPVGDTCPWSGMRTAYMKYYDNLCNCVA
jgi:hypothetical protein